MGQGGCNLSGAGIVIMRPGEAWGGRTMRGVPGPPGGRCWCKLPLPTSLLFCVCVYWGVRGILLFAFISLFFFFVWPLASPRLGLQSVEGQ